MRWQAAGVAAGVCAVFGCGTAPRNTIVVAAAVSLMEALEEIAPAFERASGVSVTFTVGASNALARQIAAGAPADVFISADDAQMAFAARAGAIDPSTTAAIVSNELVVIVPDDASYTPRGAQDLLAAPVRRVAMGEPDAVPAGVYAREYFKRIGLWERLQPRVVPTGSVRAAVAAVAGGAADAGVIYRSDLVHATAVRSAFVIPREDGPRIVYPAAVTRGSRNAAAARAFVSFLQRPDAQRVFARHGFVPFRGTSNVER